jgi:hypothetical protein
VGDKEESMAYGSTHPAEVHHTDTAVHAVTWTISMLGVFAAAIGAWLRYGPDDGTITINDRTWAIADVNGLWAPWLMIAGGGVAAIGMLVSAVRDMQHGASQWLVAAETLLAMVGVAAVIIGIVILV